MLDDDRLMNQAEPEKQPTAMRLFMGLGVPQQARLLWRRKAEIALAALICASAAVVISESLTPKYTSTAQIYIDPRELQPADRQPAQRSQDYASFAMVIESQLRIIGSNGVLLQAIQDTHLDEDPEFGGTNAGDDAEMAALENLKRHIHVTKPDRSFIINIEVWSDSAAKSALLANAISKAYLDELKKQQAVAASRTAASQSDRLKQLQEQVRIAETALAAYQVQQNPLDAQGALMGDPQQPAANSQRLEAARTATLDAQARYDQIQSIHRDAIDIDAIPRVLRSPAIANLRQQYDATRRRYLELASEIGALHPALRPLVSRLEDLHLRIRDEVERLALAAKNELTRAREYEDSLNKAIDLQKRQSAELTQPSPRLRELESDVQASREAYQSFRQRVNENDEGRGLNASSARVISEASIAQRRIYPPPMGLLAGIGFLIGALGAATWFVASGAGPSPKASAPSPVDPETTDAVISPPIQPPDPQPQPEAAIAAVEKPLIARLQEPEVVRTQSSVLTAGALPDLTRIGWPTLRAGMPVKAFLKSVGDMRAAVMRRPSAGAIPVMAVIGAGASEDRSIAALNIALAAARGGYRVLLIDADHATHALSNRLNGPGKSRAGRFGWFGIGLKDSATIETANGISVLSANRGADAVKASEAICKAIAEVRSLGGYDLVILDGPATPSGEADRMLLDVADGLAADLPMSQDINDCVREIIAALGDVEPKLIGFVLNELHPAAADTERDQQLA